MAAATADLCNLLDSLPLTSLSKGADRDGGGGRGGVRTTELAGRGAGLFGGGGRR
jgi:hypothetical protein